MYNKKPSYNRDINTNKTVKPNSTSPASPTVDSEAKSKSSLELNWGKHESIQKPEFSEAKTTIKTSEPRLKSNSQPENNAYNLNNYAAPTAELIEPEDEVFDHELASPWIRLGAHMIEGIIIGVPAAILGFFAAIAIPSLNRNNSQFNELIPLALFGVIGLFILVVLTINIMLLVKNGQTIGKKICGIRIEQMGTGQKAGFWRIIGLRCFVPGLIAQIPIIGGFFPLVNHLFIFSTDHQCLHDRIADTIVVKCR